MATRAETLTSTGIPTGKIGVWWFLASEITVFGGLIASYVAVRLGSGDWSGAAHLSVPIALTNTFVLLTSSLTMVLAFAAVEDKNPKRLRLFLGLTTLLGVAFLGIKSFEYARELAKGFTPAAGIFWSFYYGMTGLHALHVLGGIVVNLALLVAALKDVLTPNEHRVELAGLYWHFVDIVWIVLFPLLYLT